MKTLERATGIEPATSGLGSRHSTIELRPLKNKEEDESMQDENAYFK